MLRHVAPLLEYSMGIHLASSNGYFASGSAIVTTSSETVADTPRNVETTAFEAAVNGPRQR